jgi:hypothetical protein
MTTAPIPVQYGCHVDAGDGVEPYDDCAFDSAYIHDCCLATLLHANGKGRDDCSEWKPIKITKPALSPDTRAYIASLVAELASMRASRDALAEDAERYRYLRDKCGDSHLGVFKHAWDSHNRTWLSGASLDAAIDAARLSAKEPT